MGIHNDTLLGPPKGGNVLGRTSKNPCMIDPDCGFSANRTSNRFTVGPECPAISLICQALISQCAYFGGVSVERPGPSKKAAQNGMDFVMAAIRLASCSSMTSW